MADDITDVPQEETVEPTEPETEIPAEPEEPLEAPQPEDEEPPVRKSVKDYIIERKEKKIAKLEGRGPEGDTPDIRAVIREELEPIKQTFVKSKDEEELHAALTKYPDAKKIEKTVRRYMENEAYSRVPAEFIVRALLGARGTAKQKADDEAAASRQGGHSRRPKDTKAKSAWDMTDEEFQKEVSKVMSGQAQ